MGQIVDHGTAEAMIFLAAAPLVKGSEPGMRPWPLTTVTRPPTVDEPVEVITSNTSEKTGSW